MEQAYYDGKYYFRDLVRLKKNSSTFIEVDSDYVVASISDPAVRRLYFATDKLSPDNRELFYQEIVNHIPRKEIAIFEEVAALPEVKGQGEGSDGGLHTLVIWIVDRPGKSDPYYSVEIKRMYYWRLGACVPIGFLKINPVSHTILVMDTEGNYLPLAQWRIAPTRP